MYVKWVDIIPPQVTGLENAKEYDDEVTIVFDEGTATLNGETIESGYIVKEAGSYELIITDDAGNVTTFTFVIKANNIVPIIIGATSVTVVVIAVFIVRRRFMIGGL